MLWIDVSALVSSEYESANLYCTCATQHNYVAPTLHLKYDSEIKFHRLANTLIPKLSHSTILDPENLFKHLQLSG